MTSAALPRAAIRDLQRAVGREHVLWRPEEIVAFEYDATIERFAPQAVVFPGSAEEVSAVVRAARAHGLPVIPRGAGTGLSGGAVAAVGGVVVALTRLNRILEIDARNRIAVVEPGVVNLDLSKAAAPHGLAYAPDPSSQRACTIGGNVAENAGGPHCLAYGATTNHVLGLEVVLPDGTITWTGGKTRLATGYDLTGVLVGSEGTLAIVTKAVVRLMPLPESVRTLLAIFDEVDHASNAVSAIIAHGIVPAALEMLDREIIKAVEPALHVGYPMDAGAVLLIEVEGLREATRAQADEVRILCLEQGAREVRLAEDPEDRERLWAGRKGAIGALGRLAPNYYVLDGVVPRTKLPDVLRGVYAVCERTGFPVANVFHAGDGNLHPNVLFDARVPGATERVLEIGAEIMRLCVEAGGSITGEHGVGLEKRDFMSWIFSEDDLDAMMRVKRAFVPPGAADFNPCKAFPTTKGCGELTSQHIERMRALFGGDLYV
ncbi:MAG TPA: FAD-linked oxidase C-terminal domain-containing protein [Candidatus Tectomicrobia bacterium]|nr:FAD-linked oxidase C-terminal domain-containing protein [Candidatus Tectomicrobia bacterium]